LVFLYKIVFLYFTKNNFSLYLFDYCPEPDEYLADYAVISGSMLVEIKHKSLLLKIAYRLIDGKDRRTNLTF